MNNILCLSTSNYYPFPTRKQNVMNRLTDARILYVDPAVTYIAPLKDDSTSERLHAWRAGGAPAEGHEHITVYAQPPVLPFFNRRRAINRKNQKKLASYLAKICAENGFGTDFWVWCYSPTSCDVIEPLAAELGMEPEALWRRTIYDCVDRHSAYPGQIDPAVVDAMEEDLARRCYCVFATAQGLYDRLKAFNVNTHLIPNGANFELFSRTAQLSEGMAPRSAAERRRAPRFGFVGMLQDCIDYDALASVAKAWPEGSIRFVGRRLPGVDLSAVESLPNVEFSGLVPQEDLPEILAGFDVCLNVFADNALSKDVSPLKFYEYLATGKPVVSTPVPLQVRDFADCIYIAEGAGDFAARCAEALNEEPDSPRRAARIEAGRRSSWDERVRSMKEILGW